MACSAASCARFSPDATPRSHHGASHFRHNGADVGEIQIDHARIDNQIRNAAHAVLQYLIGALEGVGKRHFFVGDQKQVLIWNDDQRIDVLRQFLNALFGDRHSVATFERKRLCDDADGQNVAFARHLRDDGRRARSGSAAHASGNEHHV